MKSKIWITALLFLILSYWAMAEPFPRDFFWQMELSGNWSDPVFSEYEGFSEDIDSINEWVTTRDDYILTLRSYGYGYAGPQVIMINHIARNMERFQNLEIFEGEYYDSYLQENIGYQVYVIADVSDWQDPRQVILYGFDGGDYSSMLLTISVPLEQYEAKASEMFEILQLP